MTFSQGFGTGFNAVSRAKELALNRDVLDQSKKDKEREQITDLYQQNLDGLEKLTAIRDAMIEAGKDPQQLMPIYEQFRKTASVLAQTRGLPRDPILDIPFDMTAARTPTETTEQEIQSANQLAQGTAETNRQIDIEDAKAEIAAGVRERPGTSSLQKGGVAVGPDGENFQTVFDPRRGYLNAVTREPLPPGFTVITSTVSAPSFGAALPKTEATKIRDAEVSTQNFVDTGIDLLNLLAEQPNANTAVAGAAALINNLQQEVIALANEAGIEVDPGVFDPESYEGTFAELGIDNARMKGLITSLAFERAQAAAPGDRITEKDIERFIKEIGGNASDPRALSATLVDVINRAVRNFKNSIRIRTGETFKGDFGLDRIPKAKKKEAKKVPDNVKDIPGIEDLTPEEQDELSNLLKGT